METIKTIQLEQLASRFREKTLKSDIDILKSLANSELYFKEVYEGRYILELLQNARDAAMMAGIDGKIRIRLFNHQLEIANTGLAFDQAGYQGIMQIGESSKHSQDFIGHKGLGFKSVIQITDTPHIVTSDGTIYFDRKKVKEEYFQSHDLPLNKIPLFFFPLFHSKTIFQENCFSDYTTLIRIPLKKEIDENQVVVDFKNITKDQLLFLGYIQEIKFESSHHNDTIAISNNNNAITIQDNTEKVLYSLFKPLNDIYLPDDIYHRLEDKEKELFKDDRKLEVKIAIELDEKGIPLTKENRRLYLFYPLESKSGLSFILHAYFSVDPQRKGLRNTVLNQYLFTRISKYITGDFLNKIKQKFPQKTLELIYFRRDKGLEILNDFYNKIISELKNKKLVYDSSNSSFYQPQEIVLASETRQLDVFSNRVFDGKRLIYLDRDIRSWLAKEFATPILNKELFLQKIEEYCIEKIQDFEYFNKLYSYIQEKGYTCNDKKILLTNYNTLVSGKEIDVFIPDKNYEVELSEKLSEHISFFHEHIKIKTKSDAAKKLGCKEYNTTNITNRLMDVFVKEPLLRLDVIKSIKSLGDLGGAERRVYEDILLPVKNKFDWISPLYNPIYFNNELTLSYYPAGNFIDGKKLGFDIEDEEIRSFLVKLLVWDKPAIYLKKEYIISNEEYDRNNDFLKDVRLYQKPFTVYNDRFIDLPIQRHIDERLFNVIKESWSKYSFFLRNTSLSIPQLRCSTPGSNKKLVNNVKSCCHVIYELRNRKWISLEGDEKLYSPNQVIGIEPLEYTKPSRKLLRKHLPLIKVIFNRHFHFIQDISMIHIQGVYNNLNHETINNYVRLLEFSSNRHKKIENREEFKKFYNQVLRYVFEAYIFLKEKGDYGFIQRMKNIKFLALNEFSQEVSYLLPKDILYIDDKKLYDILPPDLKAKLQPTFTKRNKNEFGQIARKIGKTLSGIVKQNLTSEFEHEQSNFIVNEIQNLSYFLCLYETQISRILSENELKQVKDVKWYIMNEINIQLHCEINQEEVYKKEISSSWHLTQKDKKYVVLYNGNKLELESKTELQIAVLKNLFEEIIGLKAGDSYEILAEKMSASFPDQNSLESFLRKYDLSKERLEVIQITLEEDVLTPVQQFWHTILSCLGKDFEENIPEDFEEIIQLSEQVNIDYAREFHNQFNYYNYNVSENLDLLNKLFSVFGIDVTHFNDHSSSKINFKNIYYRRLNQLKNQLSSGFKKWMYEEIRDNNQHLSRKPKFEQFLSLYDKQIENVSTFSEKILEWELENDLNNYLTEKFPFLSIDMVIIIQKGHDNKWSPTNYYRRNRNKLFASIKEIKVSTKYFDEFLDGKNKSILYFEVPSEWIIEYTKKYKNITEGDKSHFEGNTPSFGNDTTAPISNFSPTDFPFRENNFSGGRSSGRGRGRSGSGSGWNPPSDDTKIKIGTAGELLVYNTLIKIHGEGRVFWVSKNGERSGFVSTGNDTLGYDIYYIQDDGNKMFVEVKATTGHRSQFQISQDEIDFGLENKKQYEIYFVQNVFHENRRITRIQEPFVFNNNESLFKNHKFTVKANNYYVWLNL